MTRQNTPLAYIKLHTVGSNKKPQLHIFSTISELKGLILNI